MTQCECGMPHPVRLSQGAVHVGHVPDAERDRVAVHRSVVEGQRLGVGGRPFEPRVPAVCIENLRGFMNLC